MGVKHCVVKKISRQYGASGLLQALQSENPCARSEAAHGLRSFKQERVVAALLERLRDEDLHVRMWAAYSLGDIGDATALPSLAALEKDVNFVAMAAKTAESSIRQREEASASGRR